METLKFKEDEVLDDFVNRATNAAELQQEIKNQIKYHLYGWFGGIIPYCTKSRITEIINKVYEELLTRPKNSPYFGFNKESNTLELSGCVADLIYSELTEEELDYVKYWFVNRYIPVYKQTYAQALQEVKNGKKETHWMWWIFPQMKGLGKSERSRFYGILNRKQAKLFLEHPILGKNLCEITQAVLDSDKSPYEIFGADVIKFRSCMLLFASLEGAPAVFKRVLNRNRWK